IEAGRHRHSLPSSSAHILLGECEAMEREGVLHSTGMSLLRLESVYLRRSGYIIEESGVGAG
ncbi:hypothetical protein KI387_040186, partial [Taxus chinensis]